MVKAYPVRRPELLRDIIQELIGEGYSLINLVGGDGTFNTITDLFVHRDVVLGILPMGTANNFARSMGIPMPLEKVADVIVFGKVVSVDLRVINDQHFINIATVGFSRDVINATPRCLKRYLGIISYLL